MKKCEWVILLIFGVLVLGGTVSADEDYMTDSGEIRQVSGGEAMTDSGEMEEVGEDGEFMTDSGEMEQISDTGDGQEEATDLTVQMQDEDL